MKRVLIVDKLASFLASEAVPHLVIPEVFAEADGVPTGEYQGIVPVVTTRVGAAEMDRMRGLRIIANYGVGYDNIDVPAARARGIRISNTPGILTRATAELTMALLFAVARRIGEGERLVRSGAWTGWAPTQMLGVQLEGRLLGVVGAGRIGRAVGGLAAALGMGVCYWSRARHESWERETGARYLELDQLLASCDVVTIHLARDPATTRLIDAAALARMKDGALLINTSRGAIVDEDALIAELKAGRIAAGLDVFVAEPSVPRELLELENVVLLPHLGSATYEARTAMWQLAWQNLLAGIDEKPLVSPIIA